jgi:hypothetical protein
MKRRALFVLFYGTLLTQIVHAGLYPTAVSPDLIAHSTAGNGGLLAQVLSLLGNLLCELPLLNGVLMLRMISRQYPTRVLSTITATGF